MALTAELRSPVITGQGAINTNDGAYVGYLVTVVTATGVINIRDGGATGAILDTIPVATAAGTMRNLAVPLRVKTSLFAEFVGGATGSITVFYN